jgi:pyruvate/2-oxoglutarate dehydrogenase complex dihydrolipoamide dehydrogenase (E3) component
MLTALGIVRCWNGGRVSEQAYDPIVLGAGPAGEVCAGRLADAGMTVAIVEPNLIGGECSYYACSPRRRCCALPTS